MRHEDTFDRQRRIAWWRQETVEAARVLIVGAGAIGNELIKNLVLLGFRDLIIWDFDAIEASNLSRTVLFRREDIGGSKAKIAAERARAMALHPEACIAWREGDAVWDLGLGLVRSVDLVFGCLDNVEARLAINRACHLVGVPFIDSGINELNCHVSVYLPGDSGCYECAMSESDFNEARRRYSCDNVKRAMVESGRIPTVQIASAWSAAVQVQEGIKVLHGRTDMAAHKIVYLGSVNYFDINTVPRRESCLAHAVLPTPEELPLSCAATLRAFLDEVCRPERSGPDARLDLQGDREFVVETACRRCGRPRPAMKPPFRLFDEDLQCATERCAVYGDIPQGDSLGAGVPAAKVTQAVFGFDVEPSGLLDMTLADLGIPDQHIVAVEGADGDYKYYELAP